MLCVQHLEMAEMQNSEIKNNHKMFQEMSYVGIRRSTKEYMNHCKDETEYNRNDMQDIGNVTQKEGLEAGFSCDCEFAEPKHPPVLFCLAYFEELQSEWI